MAREIITLSNGKRVANFSSPHSFTFTDGSEIPAVDAEESVRLKVTFNEDVDEDGDVRLSFTLSDTVIEEMKYWMKLWSNKEVDVVFCCLPMITALKDAMDEYDNSYGHWRMDKELAYAEGKKWDVPPPTGPKSLEGFKFIDKEWMGGFGYTDLKHSPFRAVRIEDRIKKLLSIEKQCL